MIESCELDVQPLPNDVLEISRRIKSGQRPKFKFTKTLVKLLERKDITVLASPKEVRINLISRYDNINPKDVPKIATLSSLAVSNVIGIQKTSSCDEYSTLSLKPAVLTHKGDGWQAVELPVDESDYSFGKEREALMRQIDETFDEKGSIWYPDVPALQVVEFKADASTAEAILEYVSSQAPTQTEVFDASLRFRPPVIG